MKLQDGIFQDEEINVKGRCGKWKYGYVRVWYPDNQARNEWVCCDIDGRFSRSKLDSRQEAFKMAQRRDRNTTNVMLWIMNTEEYYDEMRAVARRVVDGEISLEAAALRLKGRLPEPWTPDGFDYYPYDLMFVIDGEVQEMKKLDRRAGRIFKCEARH